MIARLGCLEILRRGGLLGYLGRFALFALPYSWLLVFLLAPAFIVLRVSLSDDAWSQPPYEPLLSLRDGFAGLLAAAQQWDFEKYWFLASDSLYIKAFVSSLTIACVSTVIAVLIAYPFALGMARAPKTWQFYLVIAVIIPFWTSFLIRVYAWIGILKKEGLLNLFLMNFGLIDEPLLIHNTPVAVVIGIVYSYFPFVVLPLFATLERQDRSLLEAAEDLGCSRFASFWKITFPLSLPGLFAGSFLIFIPAVGEFIIPELMGGSGTLMLGRTLWDEFSQNLDWPLASALALVILLVILIPMVAFQNMQARTNLRSQA